MRPLTDAERRLELAAARMGTDNENLNAIVEKARDLLNPDNDDFKPINIHLNADMLRAAMRSCETKEIGKDNP